MRLFDMEHLGLNMRGFFKVVHRVCAQFAVVTLFVCLVASSANAQLTHPGGWHTQEDLTLIRENSGTARPLVHWMECSSK